MWIFLHALLLIAAWLGIAYVFLAFWTTVKFHFHNRKTPAGDFTPPVSILKPLCGLDPHGYESLRSHCIQDYPDYEIIFGVAAPDDPAVAAVERLLDGFPPLTKGLMFVARLLVRNSKLISK